MITKRSPRSTDLVASMTSYLHDFKKLYITVIAQNIKTGVIQVPQSHLKVLQFLVSLKKVLVERLFDYQF